MPDIDSLLLRSQVRNRVKDFLTFRINACAVCPKDKDVLQNIGFNLIVVAFQFRTIDFVISNFTTTKTFTLHL